MKNLIDSARWLPASVLGFACLLAFIGPQTLADHVGAMTAHRGGSGIQARIRLADQQEAALTELARRLDAGESFAEAESEILRWSNLGILVTQIEADAVISRVLYLSTIAGSELSPDQRNLLRQFQAFTESPDYATLVRKRRLLAAESIEAFRQERSPAAPPINDSCAVAEVIPPGGPFPYLTPLIADITDATTAGDPSTTCAQLGLSRSVWYTLTPAVTGTYTFETCSVPTGTTVDDTVIGIYTSTSDCAGPFKEIACNDDSCGTKSSIETPLSAGVHHFVVVWKLGTTPPLSGRTAVQLRVSQFIPPPPPPPNDKCSGAIPLMVNIPVAGSTRNATNDYLGAVSCLSDANHYLTAAGGRDVTFSFTAPTTDTYSFRVASTEFDPVTAVLRECPSGTGPVALESCLGAANRTLRNTGGANEEISCLPLVAGQTVFIIIDDASQTGLGGGFMVLVTGCIPENEPNGTPAEAAPLTCETTGKAGPVSDVDFYSLGAPSMGSRVFALVDGGASSLPNYDLRVTTSEDTLEYDSSDNDVQFGSSSGNVAGTPLPGTPAFLRVGNSSVVSGPTPRSFSVASPYPIPDPGAYNSTVSVTGVTNPITNVTVRLYLTHERLQDLTVVLVSPDGAVVILASGVGGTGKDFGTSCTDATVFDDSATGSITTGAPPFVGTFRPLQPLATFRGKVGSSVNGVWTLRIADSISGASGRMECWTLTISAALERTAEPYRLYSVVQPPITAATVESEPNDVTDQSNFGTNNYFLGELPGPAPSPDVDLYKFQASAGDIIFLSMDGDPLRKGTPINGRLGLLDALGNVLLEVNDSGSFSSTSRSPGTLTGAFPYSPGEGLIVRASESGIYYARVSIGTTSSSSYGAGFYLLSVSINCQSAGGISPSADLSVLISSPGVDPVEAGSNLTLTSLVRNEGPGTAQDVVVTHSIPPGFTIVSISSNAGSCPAPLAGENQVVTCDLGMLTSGQVASITLVLRAGCSALNGASGSVSASVTSATIDPNSSNNSSSVSKTISNSPPVIVCPMDKTGFAGASCSALVPIGAAGATDACSAKISVTGTRSDNVSLDDPFPAGITTVTWTAIDEGGNSSTCQQRVVVLDELPPRLSNCPGSLLVSNDPGQCVAVVNYTVPTVADNCSGATVACSPSSGSSFTIGLTTVTCTASDSSGNTASCSFTITVNDAEAPVMTCPANIVLSAAPNQCSSVATYELPTTTDNCPGVVVSCAPTSGSMFNQGTTTVTCSAMDASGNTTSCSFNVTVIDDQNPIITCPSNQTATSSSGPVPVNYPSPVVSDNCPGVTASCTPPSGANFPLGMTTVICTATDVSSNTATCSFTVTVVPEGPYLNVTPKSLTFNDVVGQGNAPLQVVTVKNAGTGSLSFVVVSSDYGLVSPSPAGGTLVSGQSISIQVTATNPNVVGTRTATLTIHAGNAPNSPQVVTVTVNTTGPAAPGRASIPSLSGLRQDPQWSHTVGEEREVSGFQPIDRP
ncbi:MAG: HYR domain-containing protein [Acidobacteria bacterium]|nr:HYR domain-containing protein [Acidobacteriota bacterium]